MNANLGSVREDISWCDITAALQEATRLGGRDEDPPPLNLLSGSGLSHSVPSGVGGRIPVEQSLHLRLLREAAAGIRHGEIDGEEFLAKVQYVGMVAHEGLKLLATPWMAKQFGQLPPAELALVEAFEEQALALVEATELMAAYLDSGNVDDLDRGLAMAEQCMLQVDQVQDEAVELAETC
jgi:hypothetical protein